MSLEEGYRRLLALRAERLAAGERPVGWKLGFGSPAALERLGTSAPLVGFLTGGGLLESGATVSLAGWTGPVFEPEIAVHLGDGGEILAYGAAVELADVHSPDEDVEAILAGNVYHRHVVLGRERANRLDGLSARVYRAGSLVAQTDDPQELPGDVAALVEVVRATVGPELRAGDVVIAGSVVPPLAVAPGDRLRYELAPLGALELRFA